MPKGKANPRSRPKSILIWLTADELEALRQAAEAEVMPLTSWVRRLAVLNAKPFLRPLVRTKAKAKKRAA
jgi:hypothetical protein